MKERVGGDLIHKVGLDEQKADGALKEAGTSVKDVAGGLDPSSIMGMLGGGGGAAGLASKLEQDYLGKLTGKLGLDPSVAARVKDMVLPALMSLVQSKGGDLLGSLTGKGGEGLGGDLAGKLGGLGKMFGK